MGKLAAGGAGIALLTLAGAGTAGAAEIQHRESHPARSQFTHRLSPRYFLHTLAPH